MENLEYRKGYFRSVETYLLNMTNNHGSITIHDPDNLDKSGVDIRCDKIGINTYHVQVHDCLSGTTIDTYTNELDDSFIKRLKNTVSFLREDIGWE